MANDKESFIGTLKKVFSTRSSLVNIGGNKIKVVDLNKSQLNNIPNNFQFYDYERYGRLYSTVPQSLYNQAAAFNYQLAKIELYKAYEDMDRDSILASVLDIYADESSLRNEYGDIIRIQSKNGQVQEVLSNLFYDVMNIEFNLWTWIRNLVKYGDFFLKLNIAKDLGIINIQPLSPYSIVRLEDIYNPNADIVFMYDPTFGIDNSMYGAKVQKFDEYEIAHFRLIADSNFLPYGRSIIEPARKTWEQLCLAGDSEVWTPNGCILIKDIKPGDELYCVDYESKELIKSTVKYQKQTGFKTLYEIKTLYRYVKATDDHPFMIADGTYKQLKDLSIGDDIAVIDSTTFNIINAEKIVSISKLSTEPVYDIEVNNKLHNFIANGIVTHNCMMEDAMMINRIMRAPAKRLFKIDIGNIPPNEVDNFMEKTIAKLKKVPYMDPNTGDYNLKFNLQNMLEDFYMPVRGANSGTAIESLEGIEFNGIEDIDYLRKRMFAALKVPPAFLGYEDGVEGKCLDLNTLIPLIDGKTKTLLSLIEDYTNGIKNYTYSLDVKTKEIKIGEIEWAGITRKNAQVIEVILDNNKRIRCTPDHKFMLRDGTYKEAQYLNPNDALMPLYLGKTTQKNKCGYTTVYNPSTEKYVEVHRIAGEQFHNIYKGSGKVVHHKDFNKLNNYPENLDCGMNYFEHRTYHKDNIMKTMNSSENLLKRSNNLHWRECIRLAGIKGGAKSGKLLGQWVKLHGPINKKSDLFTNCIICNKQFKIHHYRKNSVRHCGDINCKSQYHRIINTANTYNTKYANISLTTLIDMAKYATSFKHLGELLNIFDNNTVNKLFDYLNIDKIEFAINNMPLAMQNSKFVRNISRFIPEYKNHKVKEIIWLSERIDTGDITIKDYHNFGTDAGVIIHNSTLAAEDLRFARSIERVQKLVESELYKIAIIHLFVQGFRSEDLVDFKLTLTPASTIYQREKIEIWKSKMDLVRDMKELKMIPKSWIYENVMEMDEDEWQDMQDQIITDAKFDYRLTQIAEQGNDPKDVAQQGQQAVENGEGENDWDMSNTTDEIKSHNKHEYDESGNEINNDPFNDVHGDKINNDYKLDTKVNHNYHGGSPLSMENSIEETAKLIENLNRRFHNKQLYKKVKRNNNKKILK